MEDILVRFVRECLASEYGITEKAWHALKELQEAHPSHALDSLLATVDATDGYFYLPMGVSND